MEQNTKMSAMEETHQSQTMTMSHTFCKDRSLDVSNWHKESQDLIPEENVFRDLEITVRR